MEIASSKWLTARGKSMEPLWQNNSLLRICETEPSQLRCGDLILYHTDNQYIAHRLIRRRQSADGYFFQAKADCSPAAEPWVAASALVARIVAAHSNGKIMVFDKGWGLWRQRYLGIKERLRADLCSWWIRVWKLDAQREPLTAGSSLSNNEQQMIWAKNATLRQHLLDSLSALDSIGVRVILLKGQALLAQQVMEEHRREMGDVDLLVSEQDAPLAIEQLFFFGYSLQGALGRLRMPLDDQVLLAHPQGSLLDLHWKLLTGGWRFRDVMPIDYAGLWRRARPIVIGGKQAFLLSAEDQWLHLCTHLILGGSTGIKWWQDLSALLKQQGALIDWNTVVERARQWHARTIVWLALDTLWRRWHIPIPVSVIQKTRPVFWRRWALRGLLPASLHEADAEESRIRKHLRELLVMDRFIDRVRLLWRWALPPAAWFAFHRSALQHPFEA